MKKLLVIVVLVLFWCNIGFAEMYACSSDLTRFGRPGEIETKVYIRKGNSFINNRDWKFVIDNENDFLPTCSKKDIAAIIHGQHSILHIISALETAPYQPLATTHITPYMQLNNYSSSTH